MEHKSLRLENKEQLDHARVVWSYGQRGLRFGQYLVNHYYTGSWPELFYERDDQRAYDVALATLAQI